MARKLLSTDVTNLKTKVKAEMNRRRYNGSVASYGGSAYDFSTAPANLGPVKGEHLSKNLTPMRAVNGAGLPSYPGTLTESDQAVMEAKVNAWATRSITDRSATDCASGCTGTCYSSCQTGCYTGCSGCSGCSAACKTDCTGTCKTGCSGCGSGCADTCTGGCKTGCSGCGSGCADTCSGGCKTGCSGCGSGCSDDCYGDCYGCSGCGSGCADECSGCGSGCADECTVTCRAQCAFGCNGESYK